MITYFLKSAACLALLLFFYHLVLEKEKMHTFNRYYLLFGVLVSFLIPFATITITAVPETAVILENEIVAPIIIEDFTPIAIEETPINYTKYLIGMYLLVSAILLFRFGRNLYKIIKKIKINQQVKQANATFVLVDDEILPHTFWNAIFINKTAYFNDEIEKELFTHELTHVTQKHTIDVLLIEVLQIVFWINPLFIFLKKAIQLNHEFLADSTVINTHKNTFQYQHLLVNKAAWNNEYYLASNLNYSLTKKRLKMMTTQSSKSIIWIKKLAVMPLLAVFVFLFAERVEAQEKQEIIEIIEEPISEQKSLTKSEIYKKYVYRNLTIQTKDKNGKYVSKKYSELSDKEKARLIPPPPLKLKKKLPTKAQFEALKDKSKYAVWIDGKVVENTTLNDYKYTDFAKYSNSHVYKNARSKRFPQENQAHLETTKYFEAQNKKRVEKFQKYLDEEFKVGEIIEEQPKKEYIDSPIIKNNPSSKQSVGKEIPFLTTSIKVNKQTNDDKIIDIREKLKNVNSLKIAFKKDSIKFNMGWFITIDNQRYYYTFDKNKRVAKYYLNGKFVDLDIVKEYKKKYKNLEKLKNTGKHYVFKTKIEKKLIDREFSDLGGMYFRMSKADKNKIPFPVNPIKPYVRLRKGDKIWYKKLSELTEKEKLLLPPPPPKPNASKEEILKAKKAYKAWKKRTGNDLPPPPPPKKAPSSFIKNVNKKTSLIFNSLDEVKKQRETESKLNDDEKRQFLLRKTIIQATTLKTDNFNYKVDGKKSDINNVYSYLHKNPLCIINTKEDKNGILTVSLDKFKNKKMSSDNLQNVYSKVFKKTK
ncbi:M56 family metallopeptidase [Polaribacter sp.]|uniref:M56 family metallopeptidase n=1 Tax=Polaribacter sp. TaxID=1920175 RepID=UPI003F6CF7F6